MESSFKTFMADIAGKKRMDDRTENAYFQILRKPNIKPEIKKEIKKRIAANHIPFVVSVANNYTARHSSKGELINIGVTGLMRAIDSYNPDSGNRFISYAVWWIRQSIYKHIYNDDDLIHVPQNERQKLAKLMKQSDLTGVQLLDLCSTDKERLIVFDALAACTPSLSMDLPVQSDKADQCDMLLSDLISGPNLYDEKIAEDYNRHAESIVDLLNGIDKEVITRSFGIRGEQLPFKEIGSIIGKSSERVRQYRNKALRKLAAAAVKTDKYRELAGLPRLNNPVPTRRDAPAPGPQEQAS